nr:MAG TPA: hypothetical protein [Caudoviricetes sp.]
MQPFIFNIRCVKKSKNAVNTCFCQLKGLPLRLY